MNTTTSIRPDGKSLWKSIGAKTCAITLGGERILVSKNAYGFRGKWSMISNPSLTIPDELKASTKEEAQRLAIERVLKRRLDLHEHFLKAVEATGQVQLNTLEA